jgi:hypothetical protein
VVWVAPERDPKLAAMFARRIAARPEVVTLYRLTGAAPNVTSVSVTVTGSVVDVKSSTANQDVEGRVPNGNIPQSAAEIIIMAQDLEAASFPMPVEKYDKITLSATGARLSISDVDMHKGARGGAVYIYADGAGS